MTEKDVFLSKENGTLSPGVYLMEGNEACAEAAIAAGCRYYAGYPITPSTEIMERMAKRLPAVSGVFLQMEDEIASIASVIGASWAGAKAMTATSGPGISLMLENIGYAAITETPIVIVDIQRAGPSTGQATRPAQGDMMQVRWGAHGDISIIALCPWSVQETWDFTILAFNLAEKYRVPVFLLSDASLAHLKETCTLPEKITVLENPDRPSFGKGEKILLTGSTHDEKGIRKTTDPDVQERMVKRIYEKLENDASLLMVEEYWLEDAEIMIFAYGSTARAAKEAVDTLRAAGVKAGLMRPQIIWPFPSKKVQDLSKNINKIICAEMNMGQMITEVKANTKAEVVLLSVVRGEPVTPEKIIEKILDVGKGKNFL